MAQPKDVDVPTGEILPEPDARQEGPTHETISDGSDPPENQNSTDENDNESGDTNMYLNQLCWLLFASLAQDH